MNSRPVQDEHVIKNTKRWKKKKKIVSLKFNGNEKAIQWEKRTLDCVDGNAKKKKMIFKKKSKNQLFPTCVLFLLACLLLGEITFKRIIQTGLELSVR